MFAFHAYQLENNPVAAHWAAAGVSTAIGCFMATVRGLCVAVMQPPGARLQTWAGVTRSVAPLYIIPFVLGSQLDCYEASWERQGRERSSWSGAAADLG